jgi:hypothetical protein
VSNEEHFQLKAETVFRLYLNWNCSGVTEICHMALPAQALRAVHVWLKSVINEANITREEKHFFVLSPLAISLVPEICAVALLAHGLRAVQVRLKLVITL